MAIVVEIISRSGTVVATHVFEQEQVVLGRGYDCEIVLHDAHVDVRHLQIHRDPLTGALSCRDLNSLNGSWIVRSNKKGSIQNNSVKIQGLTRFYSGQTFQLGKTYFRVSDSRHHLPATVPMSPWEDTAHKLGHWSVWGTLALFMVALYVWNSYLSLPQTDKLSQYFLRACYPLLGAFVYAGILGFLGKNFKHEPNLPSHFSVVILGLFILSCANFMAPYLAYWFRWVSVGGAISQLLVTVVIFCGGYVSLALATPLKRSARVVTASVAPAALIISLLINILARPEFSAYPKYDKNLIEPVWQLRQAKPVDEFLSQTDRLFSIPKEK